MNWLKYKKIIVLIAVFGLGALSGYYFSPKLNSKISYVINQKQGKESETDKGKQIQKLDLLKDYINFVVLPKEEVKDPEAYADNMEKKMQAVSDAALAEKYYATGEGENREKKILDFFNFVIEDVKKGIGQ